MKNSKFVFIKKVRLLNTFLESKYFHNIQYINIYSFYKDVDFDFAKVNVVLPIIKILSMIIQFVN